MEHKKGKKKEYDVDGKNLRYNFDIDQGREEAIVNYLFSQGIEIKTESYHIWSKYGNIFVEYGQLEGRPSGIEVTTASLWLHVLYGEDEQPYQYLFIPTDVLKEMCYSGKYRKVVSTHSSSTNMKTYGYVVSIKDILKKLNPLLD